MPQKTSGKPTPAMQQFHRFKKLHPDCVLFFRMGDFYEMFYDDAKLAHKVLGVTLTQRTEGVPMAGVPYHAVEGYLRRMIQAGYRVAVCEQVEDPAQAKGVVKRDVTRVVTPGTLTDENLLDEGRANVLAAIVWGVGKKGKGSRGKGQGADVRARAGLAAGPQGRPSDDPASAPPQAPPTASIAWADLSTGAFHVATLPSSDAADELARIAPSELLIADGDLDPPEGPAPHVRALTGRLTCVASRRPGWQFRQDEAVRVLCRQFAVATLEGFGFADDDPNLVPAGAIVHYLLETQCVGGEEGEGPRAKGQGGGEGADAGPLSPSVPQSLGPSASLPHLQPPRRFAREEHLVIDDVSLRSLEVERTLRSQSAEGSLLGVLQDCRTAMGKRLLRQWLCYPLAKREPIEQRQDAVAAFAADSRLLAELTDALHWVQDVARMIGRVSVGRAAPRDLTGIGVSVSMARKLGDLLDGVKAVRPYRDRLAEVAGPLGELAAMIAAACVESPPAHLREGGLIREGFDAQLDECRCLQRDSNTWLAGYQKQLVEETGVPLKVGYNKVFGYYIEVTAAHRHKIDDNGDAFRGWTRKQTLKNAERFITPPLKEFETKVLSAEQRAVSREQELFARLCAEAQQQLPHLHSYADTVAELDVLACFARRAVRWRYVRPTIVDGPALHIKAGRHPVLDEVLGDRFVPNDVGLGGEGTKGRRDKGTKGGEASASAETETLSPSVPQSLSPSGPTLALITGPNMAGKSTYIRQTALITLLAHTGSFVPAREATIGLCDRIFTRIGASDELHAGQSTFMVEMTETANICHHATPASLVILDEIGRGTSTLDGLSLAWAIAEHLAERGCRTLFATHYHELTELADRFDNVINLNVTVREWQDQVVFLHRIARGKTDRSYGIHVAKIAGVPDQVIGRANELMRQLEVSHNGTGAGGGGGRKKGRKKASGSGGEEQLPLFTQYVNHPALEQLRQADLDNLTPIQAFELLRKLREQVSDV